MPQKIANLWRRVFGLAPKEPEPTLRDENMGLWDKRRGKRYREFWTSVSEEYDDAVLTTYGAPDDGMQEKSEWIGEYIVESLQLTSESTVLEIGCGIGRMGLFIAPVAKEYHGADISPNMLEFARQRLGEYGNCFFHELSFSDLREFPDCRFDAVFSEAVLIHIAKEDSFFYMKEAFRVLKPGGRAYFQFYNILHPEGLDYFLRILDLCDHTGENLISRPRFHTAREVALYLERIGFQVDESASRLQDVNQKTERHHAHVLNAVVTKPEK